jgi:hypothetical protein
MLAGGTRYVDGRQGGGEPSGLSRERHSRARLLLRTGVKIRSVCCLRRQAVAAEGRAALREAAARPPRTRTKGGRDLVLSRSFLPIEPARCPARGLGNRSLYRGWGRVRAGRAERGRFSQRNIPQLANPRVGTAPVRRKNEDESRSTFRPLGRGAGPCRSGPRCAPARPLERLMAPAASEPSTYCLSRVRHQPAARAPSRPRALAK